MSLQGKVAIVTGGSRGIGRAASLILAERGAKVVVNYVANVTSAWEVVSEIEANGGEAIAWQADVRQADSFTRLVDATVETFGRIDILVSNANMILQLSLLPRCLGMHSRKKCRMS